MGELIRTVCGLCVENCGMEIEKSGDDIVSIRGAREHPYTQGNLCIKGIKAKDIVTSPLRLKSPLKKVNGEFKEISWDDAFSSICENLDKLEKKYGRESLAVYFGDPLITQGMAMHLIRLFCQVYGTPNFSCTGSLCNIAKVFANMVTFGRWSSPNFEKSGYIVLWGTNPLVSTMRSRVSVLRQKEQRATIIVIDPRTTQSARIADRHIKIIPGRDGLLALGMIKVIINEDIYDKEFVEKYTTGFEELKKNISDLSLDEVAKGTGIDRETIISFAKEFANSKPACIDQGSSLDQNTNGTQNVRATAILLAITGNIDIEGGNIFPFMPPLSPAKASAPRTPQKPPAGTKEHPLFTNSFRQGQAMVFPELLEKNADEAVRGMIVDGGNPLMTWPDTGKTEKFLSSLDMLVTIDTFMSQTARLSQIVLPASTFLERTELSIMQPLSIQKKILDPGNTLPDWKIWHELLKKCGYENELPWQDEEEGINHLLKPLGKTFKDIEENPFDGSKLSPPIGTCREKGFPTKSGKIELASGILSSAGHNPLPLYVPPAEVPDSDYPLILTTGGRFPYFAHSQFHQIPSLEEMCPEPFVEISHEDAGKLGISEGETCSVETRRGKIYIKARITPKIIAGVVHITDGWEGANVNILTEIETRDPISGFPSFKSLACKVKKYP